MTRRAALAVWDFVVGDDWRMALAAVAAIGLTAAVCALGLPAWWLAPLVALAALRWSLRGATPASPRGPSTGTRSPRTSRRRRRSSPAAASPPSSR